MFGFPSHYEAVKMPKYLNCDCTINYPSKMYVRFSIRESFFQHRRKEFICENCQSRKLAIIRTDCYGKTVLDIIKIPPTLKRPGGMPKIHEHIIKRFTKPN